MITNMTTGQDVVTRVYPLVVKSTGHQEVRNTVFKVLRHCAPLKCAEYLCKLHTQLSVDNELCEKAFNMLARSRSFVSSSLLRNGDCVPIVVENA